MLKRPVASLSFHRCFYCEASRLQETRSGRPLPRVDWKAKQVIEDGYRSARSSAGKQAVVPGFRRPDQAGDGRPKRPALDRNRSHQLGQPSPERRQKDVDYSKRSGTPQKPGQWSISPQTTGKKPSRPGPSKRMLEALKGKADEQDQFQGNHSEGPDPALDAEGPEASSGDGLSRASKLRRQGKTLEHEKMMLRRKRLEQQPDSNARLKPVAANLPTRKPKLVQNKQQRKLEIPSMIAVANLAGLLKVPLRRMQRVMSRIGLSNDRPDYMLTSDDSTLIALEFNVEPIIDDQKAFDIFPSPPSSDTSKLPHRPPIVAVMGHVDHGKTTLLDSLRSSSVAAGEAGGITQHIGAFQVSVDALLRPEANTKSSSKKSQSDKRAPRLARQIDTDSLSRFASTSIDRVTFLDTPGHAAFKNMRSRGRDVTDIVILVVAADDGVKSQTQEVIDLVKDGQGGVVEDIGVVVALTKCDKPDVDTYRAKESLGAAGLIVEDLGGSVPCVEVSAVSGKGLPELIEMITTIAEVRDLRAEADASVRPEGRIVESRVERGRGIVATVLVLRGTLKTGADIVAGTTRCRVRQMMSPSGQHTQVAGPGEPVEIAGWRSLPQAGDLVLGAESEDEARRALETRLRRGEQDAMFEDIERINEKRKAEAEEEARARQQAADDALKSTKTGAEAVLKTGADKAADDGIKKLSILIKADVNGSEEALRGVLEGIGNNEAKADIVYSGVGEVSESDILRAKSANAIIVAFNTACSKAMEVKAASLGIPLLRESIIYRLIDQITQKVTDLLPKITQTRITAEANILQVFNITVKGRQTTPVAGCRIQNGSISRTSLVRVLRGGGTIYSGTLESLKQGKTDISTVTKGMECGMAFENFTDFQAGDAVQAYEEYTVQRNL